MMYQSQYIYNIEMCIDLKILTTLFLKKKKVGRNKTLLFLVFKIHSSKLRIQILIWMLP